MLRIISGACGIISQIVVLIVLLIALHRSPWFSWMESDISFLGDRGSSIMLFNWGLIFTGVLSILFAFGLGQSYLLSRLGQLGMVSLILGSIAFSAIGIFPRTIDLPHDLSSIAFFVFVALAFLLVGAAAITASQITWGLISLAAGVLIFVFQLIPWPWSGGAIPQLLSCLPWSLWIIIFGVRLLAGSSPINI